MPLLSEGKPDSNILQYNRFCPTESALAHIAQRFTIEEQDALTAFTAVANMPGAPWFQFAFWDHEGTRLFSITPDDNKVMFPTVTARNIIKLESNHIRDIIGSSARGE